MVETFDVAATDGTRLLFETDDDGLCALSWVVPSVGNPLRFGMDRASIIAERLVRALCEVSRCHAKEPTWVMSLSEPRRAFYMRELGPRLQLQIEDEDGRMSTLELDRVSRKRLLRQMIAVYEREPLRIDPEERDDVGRLPSFVVYGLHECALFTVRHPVRIFEFVRKRENGLKNGKAFCGRPPTMRGNAGEELAAPPGMVYCVFATSEGYVFDWDWVEEDPKRPGAPIQSEERFAGELQAEPVARIAGLENLTALRTDLSLPWYSSRGDCLFCYFNDEPSYAEWASDDLTVFRALLTRELVGFKIKNVRSIVSEMTEGTARIDEESQEVSIELLLERAQELRIRMRGEEQEREWRHLHDYVAIHKTIKVPREKCDSLPCSALG